jgi:hypothetical protein
MIQVERARLDDEAAEWRPHREAKSGFYQAVQTSPFQKPRPSCSRNVMPGAGPHVSSWITTPAVGGYSYLSFTCQQVLPLQTISADAPVAKNATAPAPAMAPRRAFLNVVMTVPFSSVLCLCGVYTASPTSIFAYCSSSLFFKRDHVQRGFESSRHLMNDKERASTTVNIATVASRGEGARFRARGRKRIYFGRLFASLVGAIWLSLRVACELPLACASAPSAALIAPQCPRFSTTKGRLRHL